MHKKDYETMKKEVNKVCCGKKMSFFEDRQTLNTSIQSNLWICSKCGNCEWDKEVKK